MATLAVSLPHLILLNPDGSGKAGVKLTKIGVGSHAELPIVLAPPNDLLGLAIAEGIEDALRARENECFERFGLPTSPYLLQDGERSGGDRDAMFAMRFHSRRRHRPKPCRAN
jgi:hypothetical protein